MYNEVNKGGFNYEKLISLLLGIILSLSLTSYQTEEQKAIHAYLEENQVQMIMVHKFSWAFLLPLPGIEICEENKMVEVLDYLNIIDPPFGEPILYETAEEQYDEIEDAQCFTLYKEKEGAYITYLVTENGRLARFCENHEDIIFTEENHINYESLQNYLKKENPEVLKWLGERW